MWQKEQFCKHVLQVMIVQNLGMENDTMFSYARFEKPRTIVRITCFEKKNLKRLMDYTMM